MPRARGRLVWYAYVPRNIVKLGAEGLLDGALLIYNEAQNKVPFDDGELTLGGRVSTESNKDESTAVISYGNNPISAQYAVIQHYNLTYYHNPPESALYLQTPFLMNVHEVVNKVVDRIRDLL